ncbi:O-methylsterigmatocystin oxidoreductase [Coprinellus micaceus]|uniref:O-methylsterigmatocystin oxidoreductase n=1 Tax=Coprinellus micaceus TaxID=71717 RepID=A0A4Y7T7Y1_COPMI|nr:O-methylsterigmatocystin oxidoreductase [Coprinellus micaceus]
MSFLLDLSNFPTLLVASGGLLAALVVIAVVAPKKRNPRGLPLPPGPKGLPIIGNTLQIPDFAKHPWEVYAALCKEYGDMVYLTAMGQGILVLSSLPRAVELLDKRAAVYSSRPSIPALDLIEQDWSFGTMSYGNTWKAYRRAFHQQMNRNVVSRYHPIMIEERDGFLRKLKECPTDFPEHLRLLFGKVIMRTSYGIDDMNQNELFIHNAESIVSAFGDSIAPGKYLVNTFPLLRHVPDWIPGAGFQKTFKKVVEITRKAVALPYREAKAGLAQGIRSIHPSMVASFIEELPDEDKPERQEAEARAMHVCATTYIAGADTTVASAMALILALASHPDVQMAAQAEIDNVVGQGRLPVITDRPSLPYVHAIVKELGRWHTVAPLGITHTTDSDDEYDGYFIPKGTFVMANSWAIMHDPDMFERPFDFAPERYLKDGKINELVPDPEVAAFGFGRRICPGRYFSNDGLFLLTASLLATFDISPQKDEFGNPVALKLEVLSELVAKPLPFKCNFTLRPGRDV